MTLRSRVHLTFPAALVSEPVIYRLGRTFEVITSVRRANVEEGLGWVILDVTGDAEEVERALAWVREQGIEVDIIERVEQQEDSSE